MKIHEYQAKDLLAAAGANVPRHIVVKTPDEAAAAFDQLANGGGVVVKAQVHAGGRGAGQLMGYADKLGGVKFCTSKEKVRAVAEAMLKMAAGEPVEPLPWKPGRVRFAPDGTVRMSG